MSSEQQSGNSLFVPVAIVIAGGLIAGAVFFSGSDDEPNVPTVNSAGYIELALGLGVDKDDLEECIASGEFDNDIKQDTNDAVLTGGKGTPWSILIAPDGNQYPINGAQPVEVLRQLIDFALEGDPILSAEESQKITAEFTPLSPDDHIRGTFDAKVIIVEFSDYDCPYCKRFHSTMIDIVSEYDESDVSWVYRHFPIDQLHPEARAKAVTAECIASLEGNDAFWEFSDALGK